VLDPGDAGRCSPRALRLYPFAPGRAACGSRQAGAPWFSASSLRAPAWISSAVTPAARSSYSRCSQSCGVRLGMIIPLLQRCCRCRATRLSGCCRTTSVPSCPPSHRPGAAALTALDSGTGLSYAACHSSRLSVLLFLRRRWRLLIREKPT
jgi:hypothetical protein